MLQTLKSLGTTATLAAVLGASGLIMVGCETDAPGVKSNYVEQWTNVNGSVEDATDAAEEVLGEYDLKDIKTTATKIDGSVSGSKADGTTVQIDIRKLTSETSEISARVGTVGEPMLGKEIISKIEEKLAE